MVNNPRYNVDPPRFVVSALSTADVQRALRCAARTRTPLSVKGGGHNYAGFSAGPRDGFQLSLREMNFVRNATEFGPDVIAVGAGAVFMDVYTYLSDTPYLLAGGFCPTVGVSGFNLGGGIGALTRELGMGVDNVLQVTLVTANGSDIVVANATHNSDLFWAVRGGGGGSFGVVTEWILRVHAKSVFPAYTYGEYCPYPKTNVMYEASLLNLVRIYDQIPSWLTLSWRFTNNQMATNGLCYLYYSLRGANETYDWLKAHGVVMSNASAPVLEYPSSAEKDDLGDSMDHPGNFHVEFNNFLDMELENARFKGYARFTELPYYSNNCAMERITNVSVAALMAQWRSIPNVTEAMCNFQGLPLSGGVAGTVAPNATAFPWRNFAYASDAECSWSSRKGYNVSVAWVDQYTPRLSAAGQCPGAYLNFPWRGMSDFAQRYWGSNLARLSDIRKRWNPNSNLDFEQIVPT